MGSRERCAGLRSPERESSLVVPAFRGFMVVSLSSVG